MPGAIGCALLCESLNSVEYARSYQTMALPFVHKPTGNSPRWVSIRQWSMIAMHTKHPVHCLVPHMKAVLQGASGLPQSFFQKDILRIKKFDRAIRMGSPPRAPTAHNWLHLSPQPMLN